MNCVVSGSFDPITVGHIDIIQRAAKMFEKVYILVAKTSSKANSVLSYEDKVEIITHELGLDCTSGREIVLAKYEILPIENTLIDTMERIDVHVIVRGLRNATDLIYEMDMSSINRDLDPKVETVYLPCKPELSYVSSSMVRELCKLGKYYDASKYCGEFAANKIHRKSMKLVGLTGGIACGKSEVQKIFEKNGWFGIDLDKVSEEVMFRYGTCCDLIQMLNDEFRTSIDAALSMNDTRKEFKSKIANIIFSNKDARNKVESFLHPLILEEMWNKIYSSESNRVIVQAPLLFEANLESLFDSIVCVRSNRTTQVKRLVENRGMTFDSSTARIDSQMLVDVKAKKSDFVIENNSGIDELEEQVNQAIEFCK